ncbi:hypothetical protein H6G00_03035 [Leptolyngbya sp. FACHB-541]|uniref:hypothetical protein n=1 Tax=Leptolyngbya sp. FACHB-541 TaxID=2692810 RepID=UPI001688BE2F|nr:hypothetical protein [Leptolyngbya sp. FACHB-541]MBD1995603.1 hypothetical protein [Leptolyngbya sp. FACHB-541]
MIHAYAAKTAGGRLKELNFPPIDRGRGEPLITGQGMVGSAHPTIALIPQEPI